MKILYTLIANVVAVFGRSLFIVYRISSFLKARFLSQRNPCGVYGGQSNTRKKSSFFLMSLFFHQMLHTHNSLIYHRRYTVFVNDSVVK
jgi:hypothetical protein